MSKQNISLLTLSLVAAGAVAAFRAVGHDGAQATVQGQKVAGVARTEAADGETLAVDAKGTAVVESGAAIAVGDSLIVDNQGRAIPASALAVANPTVDAGAVAVTSSAANGAIVTQGAISGADLPDYVFADALQVASGAGKFIEVLMR